MNKTALDNLVSRLSAVETHLLDHAKGDDANVIHDAMVAIGELQDERLDLADELGKVRPAVSLFAVDMERRLAANDHKRGWLNCTWEYLFTRLVEEVGELGRTLDLSRGAKGAPVVQEAADVANFAMMLADKTR